MVKVGVLLLNWKIRAKHRFLTVFLLSISFSLFAQSRTTFEFESRYDLPSHRPLSHLTDEELDKFILGRSFFTVPWVIAPSATTARDGLGPLFNANACVACHSEDRHKAKSHHSSIVNRTLVFKLSQPSRHDSRPKNMLTMPDPVYGTQIAINATGRVPFEAKTEIEWRTKNEILPDGTVVELRYPIGHLSQLNYGELAPETKISLRIAPVLVGLSLLSEVSDGTILAMAKAQSESKSTVKGKVQWVYNPYFKRKEIGRFGYKASQSSVRMQTADAAHNDMGLTNPFFPQESCTEMQIACLQAAKSRNSPQGYLDLPLARLDAITFYLERMKAPMNLDPNKQSIGRKLFEQIGCTECHRPSLLTKDNMRFEPYTDLLLHDMGRELADNRPEYEANQQEWRTTPLWGVGAKQRAGILLLHDGRARNITEAILWHGGESQSATDQFKQLSEDDRKALLEFVESL